MCQGAFDSHLLIEETDFLGIPVYVWMGCCWYQWGVRQLDQAFFALFLCDISENQFNFLYIDDMALLSVLDDQNL